MKCLDHYWMTSSKKNVKDECNQCGDIFPCKDYCGHVDCLLETPRKCYKCNKLVYPNEDGEYFLIDTDRGKSYFVHEGCGDASTVIICHEN